MFSHVCISASDIEQSGKFYAAVLGSLGIQDAGRLNERTHCFRTETGTLLVMLPRDGNGATHSNGGTIGFTADSKEAVDGFHAAGLANGGSDEGAPGDRMEGRMYGAYLRDPVGNKICAIHSL